MSQRSYTAIARRILLEVGRPLDGNVVRFAGCLKICVQLYEDAKQYHRHGPLQDTQIVIEIANAADRLLTLLTNSKAEIVRSSYPNLVETSLPSLKHLGTLEPASTLLTGLEDDLVYWMRYEDHFRQRGPFEWMAGIYLPELFYLFVDNTQWPKFTRWGKGRKFLSFARIVLREFKIRPKGKQEYTSSSIARAVRLDPTISTEQGLLRRKGGPSFDADINDPWEWYRHRAFALACGCRSKTPIETVAKLIRESVKESGQKLSDA